jgi:hypothetical protein
MKGKGMFDRAWNSNKDKDTIDNLRNKLNQAVGHFTVRETLDMERYLI